MGGCSKGQLGPPDFPGYPPAWAGWSMKGASLRERVLAPLPRQLLPCGAPLLPPLSNPPCLHPSTRHPPTHPGSSRGGSVRSVRRRGLGALTHRLGLLAWNSSQAEAPSCSPRVPDPLPPPHPGQSWPLPAAHPSARPLAIPQSPASLQAEAQTASVQDELWPKKQLPGYGGPGHVGTGQRSRVVISCLSMQ